MTLYRDRYRVESPRMPKHDYGPGLYFVTICTRDREPWLGAVRDDDVVLSEIGLQVEALWRAVPAHYPDVRLDAFVIMPDHFHAILGIQAGSGRDAACRVSGSAPGRDGACPVSTRTRLPYVVGSFKSAVTRWCGRNGYADFAWQSRYFEHLVRDDREQDLIREYLVANPFRWTWKEHVRDHQWLRSILRMDAHPVETRHAASQVQTRDKTGPAPSLRREEEETA